MRIWLVLAALAALLTLAQLNALIASASVFPGMSVLGILEVLLPAEAAALFLLRWNELRTGARRRWGWLGLAAFASFLTLLILGSATLASHPAGLDPSGRAFAPGGPAIAPSGVVFILGGAAITAFAWWRSGRR